MILVYIELLEGEALEKFTAAGKLTRGKCKPLVSCFGLPHYLFS